MRGRHRLTGPVGILVAAALAAALPGPAAAQMPPPGGRCRAMTESAERLRCYDEEAAFNAAATIMRELDCERPPRAADTLKLLISRNAISSFAFDVVDSMNYFVLQRPAVIDGLTVIGVFGFDETGAFPFVRGRGASPGRVFGVVTQEPIETIDRWRLAHSPALMFDDTASNLKGAKDIACWK